MRVYSLFLMLMIFLPLSACQAKNEQYYRLHPDELQQALQQCMASEQSRNRCDSLWAIERDVRQLEFELKSNPQGFGQKIIRFQVRQVSLEKELQSHENKQKRLELNEISDQLEQYLAIVRWLESPES